MDNKILIKQLNSLKDIKPDNEWKSNNREILYNQIFNSSNFNNEEKTGGFAIFAFPQKIMKFISQPAMVVILVSLIIISGGIFSARAARNIKPGDSLYIARIISEKAHLAITFNKEAKNKLEIKFANEHAKDITQILANPEFNIDENKIKIEKLTEDFKKEINTVKDKISKINTDEVKDNQDSDYNNEKIDEAGVFSANLKKEENGMQIFDPKTEIKEDDNQAKLDEPASMATSTIKGDEANTATNEELSAEDANRILEEAEELFDSKNYNGTLNKLEEAEEAIDIKGEVKGVSEKEFTASSSLESGDLELGD